MKKEKYMSWDTYFMSVAILSSFRSKDRLTQNGACIADKNNKVMGIWYNWLPIGCDDNDAQFWTDNDNDPEYSRHSYVVHAEKNAILNSISQDLHWGSIYVTQFPCPVCTQAIIQVGIKKIVYLKFKPHHAPQMSASKKMMNAAGVECIAFKDCDSSDKDFILWLEKLNHDLYETID